MHKRPTVALVISLLTVDSAVALLLLVVVLSVALLSVLGVAAAVALLAAAVVLLLLLLLLLVLGGEAGSVELAGSEGGGVGGEGSGAGTESASVDVHLLLGLARQALVLVGGILPVVLDVAGHVG